MISIEECDVANDFCYAINDDVEIGSSAMEDFQMFKTRISYIGRPHTELISIEVPIGGVNVDISIPVNLITELIDAVNAEKIKMRNK